MVPYHRLDDVSDLEPDPIRGNARRDCFSAERPARAGDMTIGTNRCKCGYFRSCSVSRHTSARGSDRTLRMDYFSFVVLLGALYMIAGAIFIRGAFAGTPLVNAHSVICYIYSLNESSDL